MNWIGSRVKSGTTTGDVMVDGTRGVVANQSQGVIGDPGDSSTRLTTSTTTFATTRVGLTTPLLTERE
jgi:hypothetical protein